MADDDGAVIDVALGAEPLSEPACAAGADIAEAFGAVPFAEFVVELEIELQAALEALCAVERAREWRGVDDAGRAFAEDGNRLADHLPPERGEWWSGDFVRTFFEGVIRLSVAHE